MRIFRRSVLDLVNQFPMAKDDPDYATKRVAKAPVHAKAVGRCVAR